MPLEIQIQKSTGGPDAGTVTVKLTGSLDTATAPELERQMALLESLRLAVIGYGATDRQSTASEMQPFEGSDHEESRVRLAADGQTLEHDWCETLKRTHNQGVIKMQSIHTPALPNEYPGGVQAKVGTHG